MKIIKVLAVVAAASVIAISCTSQPKVIEDPTTVENVKDLLPSSSQVDSVSYLIGVNFGYFIKANNFGEKLSELNMAQIKKGMQDFINAKGDQRDSTYNDQFRVSPEMMNEVFNSFIGKRNQYQGEVNRREGVAFLEKNRSAEGVQETESGLQYKILEEGSEVKAGPKDTVMVSYKGTLLDGTEFDASPEGQPIRMNLNRVIPGWTEGLQLIGEGGKAILYIPSNLAYGERGNRGIAPNSTLIFEVEVAEVHPFVEPATEEKK